MYTIKAFILSLYSQWLDFEIWPQSVQCPFCLLDFDAVGHMETFLKDSYSILKTTGKFDKVVFSI